MGNCVPVLRIQDSSKSKFSSHPVQVETTVQEISIESQHQKPEELCVTLKPQIDSFPKQTSTEETFFDSQAWLDSDCEDYYSVNGDITPSTTNDTQIQKSMGEETPQQDKSFHKDDTKINSMHKTSHNKLLFELFRESFNSIDGNDDEIKPSNSANKSSRFSVLNTSTVHIPKKRKTIQPVRCCLPNLVRSMSTNESKKTLSPV